MAAIVVAATAVDMMELVVLVADIAASIVAYAFGVGVGTAVGASVGTAVGVAVGIGTGSGAIVDSGLRVLVGTGSNIDVAVAVAGWDAARVALTALSIAI